MLIFDLTERWIYEALLKAALRASIHGSRSTVKPSSLVMVRYVPLTVYVSGASLDSVKETEAIMASGVGTDRESGEDGRGQLEKNGREGLQAVLTATGHRLVSTV